MRGKETFRDLRVSSRPTGSRWQSPRRPALAARCPHYVSFPRASPIPHCMTDYLARLNAEQREVADLLAKAEAADQADVPDGMSRLACSPSQLASRSSIPEELARREERLAKLAEARAKACPRA